MDEYEELPAEVREIPLTQVDFAPMLPTLPFGRMEPYAFEQLCSDLARHHLRLDNVALYGRPGQRQYGIDIVGDRRGGGRTVIQCKRYREFSAADLTAAVALFDKGGLPFEADQFIVAVPLDVNDAKIQNERIRLDDAKTTRSVTLWGLDALDEILRHLPHVVSRYFGEAAAVAHSPAKAALSPDTRPASGNLALAALQGPVKSTGADLHLKRADKLLDADPGTAADEVRNAQKLLTDARFEAHARYLDSTLATALRRAGRLDEAAWILHDHLWSDLDAGRVSVVGQDLGTITEIARELGSESVIHHLAVLDGMAVAREQAPIFWEPEALPSDVPDHALATLGRVALLIAQDAAADPESTWVAKHRDELVTVSTRLRATLEPAQIRIADLLSVELADASGELEAMLLRARRREFSYEIAAIVSARAAWSYADSQRFEEADLAWQDAIDHSVADGRAAHAAQMVGCRFMLQSRTGRLGELSSLGQLIHALRLADPDGALRADRDEDLSVRSLLDRKLPAAGWQLRRAIRRAHAIGAWADATDSRGLLIKVYRESQELRRASIQMVLSGRTADLDNIVDEAGDEFLDVRAWTSTDHPFWVRAVAFALLAAQADLLPDADTDQTFDRALAVLGDFVNDRLIDSPISTPMMRIEALRLLAGIVRRVDDERARHLITILEPLVPREGAASYRMTDDEHVRALSEIGDRASAVGTEAVQQLLRLFETDSGCRHTISSGSGTDAFERHREIAEPELQRMADEGMSAAAETLVVITDGKNPPPAQAVVEAAALRLMTPVDHAHGVTSYGSRAVQDSLLTISLPPERRAAIIETLLAKTLDDQEPSMNKAEYLGAALNLAREIAAPDPSYEIAIGIAEAPSPLVIDAELIGSHPLSNFRSDLTVDTRPAALHLAARLASTPDERARIRESGLRLLSNVDQRTMRIVHAFREAGWELFRTDLTLLATHTLPAVRQFAALVWVRDSMARDDVGLLLAEDSDATVRRVLARLIEDSINPRPAFKAVLEVLGNDPRSSVRALTGAGRVSLDEGAR